MKLVKVDKTVSPQRYYYECINCDAKKIEKQDKREVTNYCHKCMLKLRKPRENTSKYGIKGMTTKDKKAYRENYMKSYKEKNKRDYKDTDKVCSVCKNPFTTTLEDKSRDICVKCIKIVRPMLSTNKSGYIGVCYINPRVRKNTNHVDEGYWKGYMKLKGVMIFTVRYKDSYNGSDEYKKLKCAIDRDIHIRENGLNHKKNFTDEELNKYISEGISFK